MQPGPSNVAAATVDFPPAYDVDGVLASPLFARSLSEAAIRLVAIYHEAPQAVRYVSHIRRWLVTQAAVAFYFENRTDAAEDGLTVSRLMDFAPLRSFASKNTIASYLAQMRHYKLFVETESDDRRQRPLLLSDEALGLIRGWFDSHMQSLDAMDGVNRLALSRADDRLMFHAHPIAARLLIADSRWNCPPESVATFATTNLGSNIIHDLVARFPGGDLSEERFYVGEMKPGDLALSYNVSRTQIARVLNQARTREDIGWSGGQFNGEVWISARLIGDYRRWQAVKFAALSTAVRKACQRLYG